MKRLKWSVLILIAAVISNVLVLYKLPVTLNPQVIQINLDVEATETGDYQFFYSDGIFEIEKCQTAVYDAQKGRQTITFEVPAVYSAWRLDFGERASNVKIYSMKASYCMSNISIEYQFLNEGNEWKDVEVVEKTDDGINVIAKDGDPQCIFSFEKGFVEDLVYTLAERWCNVLNIFVCIAIDIMLVGVLLVGRKVYNLIKDIYTNRKLMFSLAKNDFKTKYVGSYLGIIWAFIQPMVLVLVYWFVFQVGLRSGDVGEVPFIVWLLAGLVPWFFFSDALGAGTTSLMEYQYLVKKIVFNVSILPVVKVLSALFVHLFFMLLAVIISSLYGYMPDFYILQILYYSFCNVILVLALVYFTSAVVVFFKDTTQIISVFLQIGIWMTPIMWNIAILPSKFVWIFKMMPMYYIVNGYRDSLIEKVWFWEKPYETVWFWTVTLVVFAVGAMVFKRLKVHFADVL